jgi:TPR repeat protein
MKANRLIWTLLMLLMSVGILQLPAQQTDNQRVFFERLLAEAEKGNAGFQCAVAEIYAHGMYGVTSNQEEATKWFRKSAAQGFAEAEFGLGVCYRDGMGLPQNSAEAVKWFRRAAGQGYVGAQAELGACYYNGDGVPKDLVEAAKWSRIAAEQGDALGQHNLATCYLFGEGVTKDEVEAARWYRKAADQGLPLAQYQLGICYGNGVGVTKDEVEAARWHRKAADQGLAPAQYNLGVCCYEGNGVTKNAAEAVKWYRKAADQGFAAAQYNLGVCYYEGDGMAKDYMQANKWFNLASAQGYTDAKQYLSIVERLMTPGQIAQAQELARDFKPRKAPESGTSALPEGIIASRPAATGTGFFITGDGYLISNYHVVKGATKVRLVTGAGLIDATVVKVDAANDLALLKAGGRFAPLPIAASRTVKLGGTVATVGFPNIGLQGFSPKLAKGEIASLSGAADDPRYFQISVPVQPGNSGGALVDARGNVVGIVAAKLDASVALAASGSLPENVNYAVKSSLLLSFLESVPDVAAKLKEPNAKNEPFEDVVKSAQEAAVLVLVY